jgi:hypothetical protein
VTPPDASFVANDTRLPQRREPLRVLVLIILYPFVIVGFVWFVVILFPVGPVRDAAVVIAFVFANFLMNFLLIYHRHKTRDRWIEAEASRWLRRRSQGTSIAASRWQRKLKRSILWLPSVCALLMLTFLPLATHITIHPSSHYLPEYRIPIPWTWTAVPVCVGEKCMVDAVISSEGIGRVGVTPFWHNAQLSMVAFASVMLPDYYDASDYMPRGLDTSQIKRVDLKLGNAPLSCWQYLSQHDLYDRQLIGIPADVSAWHVVCANRSFWASFFGMERDLPVFYNVLEHITPSN